MLIVLSKIWSTTTTYKQQQQQQWPLGLLSKIWKVCIWISGLRARNSTVNICANSTPPKRKQSYRSSVHEIYSTPKRVMSILDKLEKQYVSHYGNTQLLQPPLYTDTIQILSIHRRNNNNNSSSSITSLLASMVIWWAYSDRKFSLLFVCVLEFVCCYQSKARRFPNDCLCVCFLRCGYPVGGEIATAQKQHWSKRNSYWWLKSR